MEDQRGRRPSESEAFSSNLPVFSSGGAAAPPLRSPSAGAADAAGVAGVAGATPGDASSVFDSDVSRAYPRITSAAAASAAAAAAAHAARGHTPGQRPGPVPPPVLLGGRAALARRPSPSVADDAVGDIVLIMNEFYAASEAQKNESAQRARQYEQRQAQLTSMIAQLRESSLASGDTEYERADKDKLGHKCRQLARELVQAVKKNEELDVRLTAAEESLGQAEAEVRAREVEMQRLQYEIIGLRASLDDRHAVTSPSMSSRDITGLSALLSQAEQDKKELRARVVELETQLISLPDPSRARGPSAEQAGTVAASGFIVDPESGSHHNHALQSRLRSLEAQIIEHNASRGKLLAELRAARDRICELEIAPARSLTASRSPTPRQNTSDARLDLRMDVITLPARLSPRPSRLSLRGVEEEETLERFELVAQHLLEWKKRTMQASGHVLRAARSESSQGKLHQQLVERLESEIQNLQDELSAAHRRLATKGRGEDEDYVDTLVAKLRRAEQQLRQERLDHGQQLGELAVEISQLRSDTPQSPQPPPPQPQSPQQGADAAQNRKLAARVAELEQLIQQTEADRDLAEATCEEARQRIATLESSRESWWKECSQILRQMAARRKEAALSLQELDALRAEVEQLREGDEDGGEGEGGLPTGLLQELQAERMERSKLESLLETALREPRLAITSLEQQLRSAEMELERSRRREETLDHQRTLTGREQDDPLPEQFRAPLDKKLAAAVARADEAEAELADLKKLVRTLERKRAAAEHTAEDCVHEKEAAEKGFADSEREVAALSEKLTATLTDASHVPRLRERIKALEQQLASGESTAAAEALRNQLQQAQRRGADLGREVDDLKHRLEQADLEIQTLTARNQRLYLDAPLAVRELSDALDTATGEKTKLEGMLRTAFEESTLAVQTLEERLLDATAQITDLSNGSATIREPASSTTQSPAVKPTTRLLRARAQTQPSLSRSPGHHRQPTAPQSLVSQAAKTKQSSMSGGRSRSFTELHKRSASNVSHRTDDSTTKTDFQVHGLEVLSEGSTALGESRQAANNAFSPAHEQWRPHRQEQASPKVTPRQQQGFHEGQKSMPQVEPSPSVLTEDGVLHAVHYDNPADRLVATVQGSALRERRHGGLSPTPGDHELSNLLDEPQTHPSAVLPSGQVVHARPASGSPAFSNVNINLKIHSPPKPDKKQQHTDHEKLVAAVEAEVATLLDDLKKREDVVQRRERNVARDSKEVQHAVQHERFELDKRYAVLAQKEQELRELDRTRAQQLQQQQRKRDAQKKAARERTARQQRPAPSPVLDRVQPLESLGEVSTTIKHFLQHNSDAISGDTTAHELKKLIQDELARGDGYDPAIDSGAPDLQTVAMHSLLESIQNDLKERSTHRKPRGRRSRRSLRRSNTSSSSDTSATRSSSLSSTSETGSTSASSTDVPRSAYPVVGGRKARFSSGGEQSPGRAGDRERARRQRIRARNEAALARHNERTAQNRI
ncbi:hypothetical protein DIPPA_24861 [Diplonema papillatum]|nr:hypothetical protein DIPPA_24861 [Diplonema papillatum]